MHAPQPHTRPSGRSGLGRHFRPQNTEKPQVAASRLSSFHSQTRTATVIGRPSKTGANSVSSIPARIAPPRWGTRGPPMQVLLRMFPALRKKRAVPGTCLAGQLHLALEISPSVPTCSENSLTPPMFAHTSGGVLANLSKIPRKRKGVKKNRQGSGCLHPLHGKP